MFESLIFKLKKIIFPKSFKIQTFTYYIPSPPPRDSGNSSTSGWGSAGPAGRRF